MFRRTRRIISISHLSIPYPTSSRKDQKIITIITKRDVRILITKRKNFLNSLFFPRFYYPQVVYLPICRANNLTDSSLRRGIPSIEVRTTLRRVRFLPLLLDPPQWKETADYLSFCSSGSFRTKEHASRGGRLIRKQRESVYSRLRSVPT